MAYGAGSLTTALAPNLAILVLGWSLLEGIGAALIIPAIVALVAGNFPPRGRPRAYGLVMAAGAIAVAVGPLIGGFAITYFSWRWVFVGEVLIVLAILALARRVSDAPPEGRPSLDLVGTLLSAAGLGLTVFGVLRSSEWGWIQPKPDGPEVLGVSPVVWLVLGGLFVVWLFLGWERHREASGAEPLVRPELFANRQLTGGLLLFFFQYLIQAGLIFTIPLYLSVALGLSAIDTGVRILPLSLTLLLAAAGAEIVTVPLLLAGPGIGALASQLGSVTVSAVPDEQSPEVGGLQNTGTNLGASIGTALAGSILIAGLTTSFLTGIQQNPTVPDSVKAQANVKLAGGMPFISDADLQAALDKAGVSEETAIAVSEVNQQARLDGLRAALVVLALIALLALFSARRIPTEQPGSAPG